jgi:hypothetical protein
VGVGMITSHRSPLPVLAGFLIALIIVVTMA